MSHNMPVIYSKSIFSAPVVVALAIQGIAFFLSIILTSAVALTYAIELPLSLVAVMQGLFATAISRWRHMATWWLLIQLCFPVAVFSALSLNLPPVIFLVAFVFLSLVYWTTFRTQVPFYPSGPEVWSAVAGLLPERVSLNFIDIGSGLGGLVLHLDRQHAESRFTGIELAPLPWLISVVRARVGRRRCRFLRGDYNELDFSRYDVIFAYLSPAAMSALWEKACVEMRPGALLISYEFGIATRNPNVVIRPSTRGAELYCWRMKQDE